MEKELIQGSSLLISELSNYNGWLAGQLNSLGPLEGTILEFGCGSGGLTGFLIQLPGVRKVIANDISPHVKEFWMKNYQDSPGIEFSDVNIFENPESFAAMKYDWAVSSNTLEHIEDDTTALRRIVEYARLKTAVILVPAFGCLYGTCDQDGGHRRRYTKASFRKLAASAGLQVDSMFYFNMVGALCWWFEYVFLRKRNYSTDSHKKNYSLFDSYIVPLYSKIERTIHCPLGLSLVARVSLKEN